MSVCQLQQTSRKLGKEIQVVKYHCKQLHRDQTSLPDVNMPPLHSPIINWVMERRIFSLLAQPGMKYYDIIEEIYRQTKKVMWKSKITKLKGRMEEGKVNTSSKKEDLLWWLTTSLLS